MLVVEIAVLAALVLLNGFLALSELAVVSARRARLQSLAGQGVRGAAVAAELAGNPGRFLSAVQVGISLVGILAGAFSGTTLGGRVAGALAELGVPHTYADPLGIGVVVVATTYLSVVVGELVPKQLALANPERLAAAVAPFMAALARLMHPAVVLLDVSGRIVLQTLGAGARRPDRVTDEEIRALILEAETAGVIEPEERSMIAQVMRLADRQVRAVMTPRPEVDMIDLDAPADRIRQVLHDSFHSSLPAFRGSADNIVGVVQGKDLLKAYLAGQLPDARDFVRPAIVVPDTLDALDLIEQLKASALRMALVHDEYGHFLGIVTAADILEAITGAFRSEEGPPQPKAVRRAEGEWLIDADLPADEMADLLGIGLPASRGFSTTAGFVLAALGRLPEVGEHVVVQGWRFEVVDLDGRRIDKVLAQRVPAGRRAR